MKPNLSKYRLVLGGDLIKEFPIYLIKKLINTWVKETGAKNVSSGVIRADMSYREGAVIYSCHFDSSHWTGIGFEGFDKKKLV